MKFSFIQLFLICLSLTLVKANSSYAQEILDQKIDLQLEDVSMKAALKKIEKKSSIFFTYRPELIKDLNAVSINADDIRLESVLSSLLSPFDINYKVFSNSNVVLTLEPTHSEEFRMVSGTVKDDAGLGLFGANVLVKGTGQGTTTDLDGNFSIDVPNGSNTLIISFTGYTDTEVDVTGVSTVNVILSQGVALESVTILGSRGKPRTNVDRPVPIDVINAAELRATGQADIGQSLHFSAPSFSAVKFGINDLAPLVDPASLRGLSPDQTLLLLNGKRRHKVAFFSNNAGVGKGQLANDINSIPSAAVKRVEILRDGAAAQYGSDAIAGVMNMQLNDSREGGNIRMYYGSTSTSPKYDDITNAGTAGDKIYGDDPVNDGQTISASANFGMPWGDDGFVNTTLSYSHAEPTDRSGTYSHSSGWYTAAQTAAAGVSDEELQRINGINPDRAVLGTAESTNMGIFVNAGRSIDEDWDFYTFGGITKKEVIGGVFTRTPARTSRAVLEIFPDGFNPEVPSNLTDYQITSGIKGNLGNDWNLDLSMGYSGNEVDLFARNTVNPSMGILSPTEFHTGSLGVTQSLINADATKTFGNTTLAVGTELRFESFQQSQGQIESYLPGEFRDSKDIGSSGREGFTARTDGEWRRNNKGVYAEVESDITDAFLVAAAIRLEDYSDFGSDFSYKLASRYKVNDQVGIRASVNRSFRAPGLAQYQYSNFSQISFDNDGNSVLEPILPIRDVLVQEAFGFSNLNPETSFDIAAGVTAQLDGGFSLTVDAYQINISDRILALGGINPADFSAFNGANYDEITIFTNAVDTKTSGLDIVASYKKFFDEKSNLGVTLAANFNSTTIPDDGVNLPASLSSYAADLTTANNDIVYLVDGAPKSKIIGSVNYNIGKIGLLLRATNFGEVSEPRLRDDNGDPQILSSKTVLDFSVTGNINKDFSVTFSANNFTDVYPDMLRSAQVRKEVIYSRRVNQFGTSGRFLSLALNYNF